MKLLGLGRRQTSRDSRLSSRLIETGSIQPLEKLGFENPVGELAVNAVLLENGRFIQTKRSIDVMMLILRGYNGLGFGDDGTYTAYLASELALNSKAIGKVTAILDEAVHAKNPAYCAEFVGRISFEAAIQIAGFDVQRELAARLSSPIPQTAPD